MKVAQLAYGMKSMFNCVLITLRVSRRIQMSGSLFGNAAGREVHIISRRERSGLRCGSHPLLTESLWHVGRKLDIDNFRNAFAEHCKRRDQHPKTPELSGRREEVASE